MSEGSHLVGELLANMVGGNNFAVFAVGENIAEKPKSAVDRTDDAFCWDGGGDRFFELVVFIKAAVGSGESSE